MGGNPSLGLVLHVVTEWLFGMRPSPAGARRPSPTWRLSCPPPRTTS